MTTREYVNVNGLVPTINEVAAYALSVGFRPRIVEAAVEGMANILFATANSKRKTQFHTEMKAMGWAFTQDKAERSFEQDTFYVLVTI